ncbi:MAG: o-succinylbenzoate synthase [Actinobacteria bacterium]|nr:o-succinylbenzoate synthase [Actinomycetota bacterium]
MVKPALTDLLASARVVSLPLRTKFRGVVDREVMLFEGPNGWAEWSPFLEYPDEEAAVWLSAAIEFAYGKTPTAVRDRIPVNATLPAVAPDQVAAVLARFGSFSTVKIKVAEPGQTPGQDVDRIVEVRKLYPEAKIRLDANGGWSPELSFSFIKALAGQGIELEYLEQPCKTIDELARLRQMIAESSFNVPIAADESVRKASDPMLVVEAEAADILVLKVAPLGGISRAMEIARGAGLPVVVSSALDSSVGISMGAHLAAALPDLRFDCGLATASLLAGDVTRQPLLPVDGFIDVRRVEIDQQKLDIFEAEDHRIDWWVDRLDRAFKLLN